MRGMFHGLLYQRTDIDGGLSWMYFSRSLRPWGSDYLYNLEEPLKLDQHGSHFGMAAA
jgi:hypothetical protein